MPEDSFFVTVKDKSVPWVLDGVQMTEHEFRILRRVLDRGTCPYCGKTGYANKHFRFPRHRRNCGRGLSLLEKEKLFSALIEEERGAGGR